ncbi:MAG: DUF2799 domain-containing protein [Bdellovibrionaceae bacterium]|nr:DUF2799 domain-containing protein [Pseudobdellovibrionaceae bacterium]
MQTKNKQGDLQMMSRIIASAALILTVTACGTSSKQEYCSTTDWQEEGKKIGLRGDAEDSVMKEQKLCAELGIQLPLTEYKIGWDEGIQQYCSEENAFTLGQKSEKHKAENCPIVYRPQFLTSYEKGKKVQNVNQKIEKVEKKIDSTDAEKEKLQAEISKKRKQIEKLEGKESSLRSQKEDLIETKTQN